MRKAEQPVLFASFSTSGWGRVKLPTGMQILQLQLRELPKVLPRPDQIPVPCTSEKTKLLIQQIPLRGRPLRLCGPKATKNGLDTSMRFHA